MKGTGHLLRDTTAPIIGFASIIRWRHSGGRVCKDVPARPGPGSFKDRTIYHIAFDLRWEIPRAIFPWKLVVLREKEFQGELFMGQKGEGARQVASSWIFLNGSPKVWCIGEFQIAELVTNLEVLPVFLAHHPPPSWTISEISSVYDMSERRRECKQNTIVTI